MSFLYMYMYMYSVMYILPRIIHVHVCGVTCIGRYMYNVMYFQESYMYNLYMYMYTRDRDDCMHDIVVARSVTPLTLPAFFTDGSGQR